MPAGVATVLRDKLAAAAEQREVASHGDRSNAPDEEALSWHVATTDLISGPGGAMRTTTPPAPPAVALPPVRDDSSFWDAGSADFLPLFNQEG
jgi:hypothetical protein